jgi:hypothetical protein
MASNTRTFILDFITTDFNRDSNIAITLLLHYKNACGYKSDEDVFALEDPVSSAGWIFFQAVHCWSKGNSNAGEIDQAKGKKFSDKFVSWLLSNLKAQDCRAQIKLSTAMKDL